MKVKAFLPKLRPDDRGYFLTDNGYRVPRGRAFVELGRTPTGTRIEFDPADDLELLAEVAGTAITEKNFKQVWAVVRQEFVDKVGWRGYGAIPTVVLDHLGYGGYQAFDILRQQKGIGFMGGTDCGTKLHYLTYDKMVGVTAGLDPLVTEVAQAWYNLALGQLRYTRQEKKHLRDNIGEDELCITLNAHPDCQRTVAFVWARGFPVLKLKAMPERESPRGKKLTCAHCCVKGRN